MELTGAQLELHSQAKAYYTARSLLRRATRRTALCRRRSTLARSRRCETSHSNGTNSAVSAITCMQWTSDWSAVERTA
ncbi:hypothetical protein PF002_g3285 [Phytophthora fragariae]|uniref:Uncharacterized protein n=1 Tax=Phytophthora fragariae TaxID=53985 RepID=A0A6A4AD56_9STRA|nr:hypothetical protein PF003_g11863 [Phytophthora fragariae]KAE9253546.1 hypothetical protein PF002_g3285 [Phytophthora fragariae]